MSTGEDLANLTCLRRGHSSPMPSERPGRGRGGDGITRTVEAQGSSQASSLFEVAAAAVALLRNEGWTDALTPNTVLQVEVQLPPIVHQVPFKAVERWAAGPNAGREKPCQGAIRSWTQVA